ncbi:hypothetical protein [Helicobacter sp. 13S00477-4]|uniref:hypothetical protein n=1 Tax=Helicobacter sp. 13S00477-4 TaxID=1905759 RepID=UPI000BA6CC5C|nr:hypothetical protein [Helicobacter sp. 13S00477-4]PAF52076.1 hypothetical protein BKH44_04165 [Helicobacter sp. 13S00477-4]
MKTKIFGSVVLMGAFLSSMNAADFTPFGHIGGFYDKGFGDGNKMLDEKDDKTKTSQYGGITAQVGLDVGFGNVHIGAAGWGAFPVYGIPKNIGNGDNYAQNMYSTDYADLSDLYVKYDGQMQLAVGRFDNSFLDSDWIIGHTQGVAAKWDTKYFGAWATWVNDASTFGYQPNRFGSELSAFNRYSSSFNHFDIGKRDLFAGGINIDLGFLKIDPFVHYFMGGVGYADERNHSMIQAGTKLALEFGNDNGVKSITTGRFLWQNLFDVDKDDTFLLWVDEEVRFNNIVKAGAGWYTVGKNNGISSINDKARFYGWRYLTGDYSNYYFGRNESSWYVFAGLETNIINFDLLYANGDYNEFSAIVSWNVFETKYLGLQIGGGYVSNGFQKKEISQNNAVAFAKITF